MLVICKWVQGLLSEPEYKELSVHRAKLLSLRALTELTCCNVVLVLRPWKWVQGLPSDFPVIGDWATCTAHGLFPDSVSRK